MKRPHNRVHCSAPEKGIGKNKGVPVAPSSFLHQEYSTDKKVQNRFSSSTIVGSGRQSHLDSAPPIGEVFYWASSSCPSQSLWVGDGETYSAVGASVVWGEHWWVGVRVSWRTEATQEFWPIFSAVNAVQNAFWHHCFCPHCFHCFHFSCSLLHAKPGFIVGRITEAENTWCLMLCYFNFMIAVSSVEWALIAGDTRWERHYFELCQAEINILPHILTLLPDHSWIAH